MGCACGLAFHLRFRYASACVSGRIRGRISPPFWVRFSTRFSVAFEVAFHPRFGYASARVFGRIRGRISPPFRVRFSTRFRSHSGSHFTGGLGTLQHACSLAFGVAFHVCFRYASASILAAFLERRRVPSAAAFRALNRGRNSLNIGSPFAT
jgi:hypothetical protein